MEEKKKTKKEKNKKDVINPLEEEVDKLNALVDSLNEQIAQLKNDYARAYADTENLKKRLMQEAQNDKKYRIQSFAKEVLPAIDNLERALAQDVESEEAKNYKKGIELTYNQLMKALNDEGVSEIDVLDKDFDANVAQAIMLEKREGVESGKVIEVLQKGYILKDRILRAAMVKVSE